MERINSFVQGGLYDARKLSMSVATVFVQDAERFGVHLHPLKELEDAAGASIKNHNQQADPASSSVSGCEIYNDRRLNFGAR